MDTGTQAGRLLGKTFAAMGLGAVAVVLCYFFVDRPVAYAFHDRDHRFDTLLRGATLAPPIVQEWVPAILVALAVRRAWGPLHRWERAVLAAGVAVVLADQFKETLAYAAGRYWPETWIDHNPSLIRDGDAGYGFHPFHAGSAYGSFPSGHTARTLAFAAVVWVAYPYLRWLCVATSGAVAVGLVGMNYHFVGDVVAGGVVGGLVGAYAAWVAGLTGPPGNGDAVSSR